MNVGHTGILTNSIKTVKWTQLMFKKDAKELAFPPLISSKSEDAWEIPGQGFTINDEGERRMTIFRAEYRLIPAATGQTTITLDGKEQRSPEGTAQTLTIMKSDSDVAAVVIKKATLNADTYRLDFKFELKGEIGDALVIRILGPELNVQIFKARGIIYKYVLYDYKKGDNEIQLDISTRHRYKREIEFVDMLKSSTDQDLKNMFAADPKCIVMAFQCSELCDVRFSL
ncbi:hypothetical protein Ciccas_014488 [Cichlidogyrus casuarinus]|uniref:Uncharacterized protein n=1 Tax=Cichlidogyrus casuarinus TaxID=1844966 RepID=A0ABD2PI92_9PLAT